MKKRILEFHDVTISNDLTPVVNDDGTIAFVGIYSPVNIGEDGDNTLLYLGAGSTLYYPSAAMSINACRAYFQLNGITAGDTPQQIRAFSLNFGEASTGILDAEANSTLSSWFSLDGRKLSGKPAKKGVYINHGKKIVIK